MSTRTPMGGSLCCTIVTAPRQAVTRLTSGQVTGRGDPPAGRSGGRLLPLAPGRRAGPVRGVQDDLADADRRRRDLHALVLPAELQGLLEGEHLVRDERHEDVAGGL